MGTGEPFDNYDNVLSFIRIINSPFGLDIGARHITVSTCGVVPGILKFGKEGLQINLAISLHAPNHELRKQLMPIEEAYPLDQLIPAVLQYGKDSGGRRVTFEYILIKGVNDSIDCARQLAKLIAPTFGYVNLIPYNPVMENGFERSPDENVELFHNFLLQKHIKSTIRKEFGSDIDAACGQLRAKHVK
jgi:23S rRNA (adenine2503-C2)-methyltransferase